MRRYLLVDDNGAFADNLAEILRDLGAEVDVEVRGEDALERVTRTRYDALVTDMRMPVMGGAELVHRMRQLDPGLPAIVVTAYSNDDDLEAARHEGLLAVLAKPVPLDRLVELLGAARRDALLALVEDDAALLDNLSEVLRGRGITPVTAGSLVEAERFGAVRPFAGLVDLRVPGGDDGHAMLVLARRFPGLPLIVVTGHAGLSPPAPHEGIFLKPFDTATLLHTVERLYAARDA